MNFGSIFLSEALGTGVLVLLGIGVVANVLLTKSKGLDGGWLLINVGWGFAVLAGVYVAYKTGGHLNPAVTIGILFSGADEF
ncbi:aquaporin, partial [Nocardia asiatica]|uniref:aquaporin n=1 Tax=Nocardia asiatica TaxID=209252 RepID=UPI0005BD9D7C